MKHLLPSVINFFSKRGRTYKVALNILVLSALVFMPLIAQAQAVEGGNPISAFFTGGLGIVLSPITIMMWVIFKIATVILGIAGVIFNWAVLVVVFEFSKYLGNSPGMTLAWGILRDFGNIALLFGFVFMGIATILDLHSYPWKKALPKLVMAAVLLNFSLFIAEAVVDTTNVLAATLYDQTYGGQPGGCRDGAADLVGCMINTGLAGIFLEKIQITTAYAPDVLSSTFDGIGAQLTAPIEHIMKYVLLSIVTTIAAVVLLAGAFMLISRGVVLAFLLVTSPIGIAGAAVPQLEKLAADWWKKLIDQALFAPVFILLLLVSLKMTDGLDRLLGTGGLTAALSLRDVGSTTGTLLFFTLIIGFFIGSLMLASRFGIYGADMAIKTAGGAVYGAMGWAGRRTLGAASNRLHSNLMKSRFGTTTLAGKVLAGVAAKGAGGSFDFRGTGVGKLTKMDFGQTSKVGKSGRIGELKDVAEKDSKHAEALVKARKAEDQGFEANSADLQRKADLARARGNESEALTFEEQKGRNDSSMVMNQLARLSKDDLDLLKYHGGGGTVTEGEKKAGEAEARALTNLAAATAEVAAHSRRIAELKRDYEQMGPITKEHGKEAVENEIRNAERDEEIARQEQATADARSKTARLERENAEKARKTYSNKKVDEFTSPKYAMEQYARSLDETSQKVLGRLAYDGAKLRAGRDGIRSGLKKSELDSAFDHLRHTLEHAHSAHPEPASATPKEKKGDTHAAPDTHH